MSDTLRAGLYKHYKGAFYQASGVGQHSETGELLVSYVALDLRPGPRLRFKPFDMWRDQVVWPDGVTRQRFVYQGIEVPKDVVVE